MDGANFASQPAYLAFIQVIQITSTDRLAGRQDMVGFDSLYGLLIDSRELSSVKSKTAARTHCNRYLFVLCCVLSSISRGTQVYDIREVGR